MTRTPRRYSYRGAVITCLLTWPGRRASRRWPCPTGKFDQDVGDGQDAGVDAPRAQAAPQRPEGAREATDTGSPATAARPGMSRARRRGPGSRRRLTRAAGRVGAQHGVARVGDRSAARPPCTWPRYRGSAQSGVRVSSAPGSTSVGTARWPCRSAAAAPWAPRASRGTARAGRWYPPPWPARTVRTVPAPEAVSAPPWPGAHGRRGRLRRVPGQRGLAAGGGQEQREPRCPLVVTAALPCGSREAQ